MSKNIEINILSNVGSYETLYPKINLSNNDGTSLSLNNTNGSLNSNRLTGTIPDNLISWNYLYKVTGSYIGTIQYTSSYQSTEPIGPTVITGLTQIFMLLIVKHSSGAPVCNGVSSNFSFDCGVTHSWSSSSLYSNAADLPQSKPVTRRIDVNGGNFTISEYNQPILNQYYVYPMLTNKGTTYRYMAYGIK